MLLKIFCCSGVAGAELKRTSMVVLQLVKQQGSEQSWKVQTNVKITKVKSEVEEGLWQTIKQRRNGVLIISANTTIGGGQCRNGLGREAGVYMHCNVR